MGKGSSNSANTTSTTTSSPWGPLKPYLKQYMSLLGNTIAPGGSLAAYDLPNMQLANFTPDQLTALSNMMSTGQTGMGVSTAATGLTNAILGGDYLNPATNPYLGDTYNAAAQALTNQYKSGVAPSEMSAAAQAGAFGGSADAENRALNQYNFAGQLQNLAANMYGANYQNALNEQGTTLGKLPSIELGTQMPAQSELTAGSTEQAQQQAGLNTNYQNAYNQAMWPYELLNFYGGGLGALSGTGGTTTTTGPNPNYMSSGQLMGGLGMLGLGASSLLGGSAGLADLLGGGASSLGGGLATLMDFLPALGI